MTVTKRVLSAPKSNRVLFPPRIAERWSETTDTGSHANDNEPVTGRWITRPARAHGKVVSLFDDGPTAKPHVASERTVHWPLEKALRADRDDMRLNAALTYRRIEELANAPDIYDTGYEAGYLAPEQRIEFTADGKYKYKGIQAAKAHGPTSGYQAGQGENRIELRDHGTNEDNIHARLDAKPLLKTIEDALGPLLQPVRDAVVNSMTLDAIGRREGFNDVPRASAVGKALVYRGLGTVAGTLGDPRYADMLAAVGLKETALP